MVERQVITTWYDFDAITLNGAKQACADSGGTWTLAGTPPTIIASTPALGDTLGGTPLTLEVTGTVRSVSVGGTPCTQVVQRGTVVRCVAPAKPRGTYDVAVSNAATTPLKASALKAAYRAWDPPQDYPHARVYDSAVGVTHANGLVNAWRDRGPDGKNAFATGGSEQPQYVPGRFANGRPGILFDGSDDRLKLAAADSLSNGRSIFWVSKHIARNEIPDFPLQQPALSIIGHSESSIYVGGPGFIDGAIVATSYSDPHGVWERMTFGSGLNDGTARVYGVTHDASTGEVKAYVDGTRIGEPVVSAYNTRYAAWDTIGAGLNGADAFRGEVSALVVVPGTVDDPTNVTTWLRGKGVVGSYEFPRFTSNAEWRARDGAGLAVLGGYLYLLGGWNPLDTFDGQTTTNEVWRTPLSDGSHWTLVQPHDGDPPQDGPSARWRRRHACGWLTHAHQGTEYIYVVGGDQEDGVEFPGDVWRSTGGDSPTWERVTNAAPWAGRVLHMTASFNGALYVMGGQTNLDDPSTALNDVWTSRDGGKTWQRLPDAPWGRRGAVYNPTVFAGRLWVIGGGTFVYDTTRRTYFNDVWSFDGSAWTQVLANGHSQWSAREYHNTRTYDGQLWVLNGYNSSEGNIAEVISSPDGVNWTKHSIVPWAPSHADAFVTTRDGVWLASGNGTGTDVFRIRRIEW